MDMKRYSNTINQEKHMIISLKLPSDQHEINVSTCVENGERENFRLQLAGFIR